MKERLVRAVGADYSVNIVELSEDPDGIRKCVAYVEVDVVNDNIVITIRRIDEAKAGPISVVMV